MSLDKTAASRLTALRRTDRTGFWASDEPASGKDSSGAVTVTVDPTNRVIERLRPGQRPTHLRDPERMARAVDEAAGAARAARLRASRAGSDDRGLHPRPDARSHGPSRIGRHAVENFQKTGTTPSGRLRGTSASTSTATSAEPRSASPTTGA